MQHYEPATYGDHIADRYDEWFPAPPSRQDTVDMLTELIGGPGRILELGVGTGTFAIALACAGHEVVGVDASPKMLQRLAERPDGQRVTTVLGDFADVDAALAAADITGAFDIVVAFTNTFTNLTSSESQKRCLHSVAGRLAPAGALVLEMAVSDDRSYPGGQALQVAHIGIDHIMLQVALYDRTEQVVDGATVVLGHGGTTVYPVRARNVTIAELDLMAELAGLLPAGRYADWTRSPYTGGADYISVYTPR